MKRLYRFLAIVIILIISQSGCVSALSATIVGADLITVTTIGHGTKYAGIITSQSMAMQHDIQPIVWTSI